MALVKLLTPQVKNTKEPLKTINRMGKEKLYSAMVAPMKDHGLMELLKAMELLNMQMD